VLDLGPQQRRHIAEAFELAPAGILTATHNTCGSMPCSSVISSSAIGRANTMQPGNVGSVTQIKASSASPSSDSVSGMNP
jgi:hypothetical protein